MKWAWHWDELSCRGLHLGRIRSWDREAVLQLVPAGRGIELALNVVPVVSLQTSPGSDDAGSVVGVEAVRHEDTDEVTDQIAVVEVVPNEDSHVEFGGLQRLAKAPKPALEVGGVFGRGKGPLAPDPS